MSSSNWVHLENCDICAETDAAFLVRHDDEEKWIPKSQLADPEDYEAGDQQITLSMTEWIAKQKEWE